MEEISQESLVINQKRRNASSINVNFPSDFKNQLINAARITTDRHLTQTSLFLLEMANSLKKSENEKFKPDSSPGIHRPNSPGGTWTSEFFEKEHRARTKKSTGSVERTRTTRSAGGPWIPFQALIYQIILLKKRPDLQWRKSNLIISII